MSGKRGEADPEIKVSAVPVCARSTPWLLKTRSVSGTFDAWMFVVRSCGGKGFVFGRVSR